MSAKLLGSGSLSAATVYPPTRSMKDSSRRKHRCWRFHVSNIADGECKEVDVLPPFRKKYTSVKRLVLNASSNDGSSGRSDSVVPGLVLPTPSTTTSICVEVEFAGPQPSQGPGSLLCELLAGASVEAKPVHLERGRKKKTKNSPGGGYDGSRGGRAASKSPPPNESEPPPRPSLSGNDDKSEIARATAIIMTTSSANSDANAKTPVKKRDGHVSRGEDEIVTLPFIQGTDGSCSNGGGDARGKLRQVSYDGCGVDNDDPQATEQERSLWGETSPVSLVIDSAEDDSSSAPGAGVGIGVTATEAVPVLHHQDQGSTWRERGKVVDLSAEPSSPVRKRLRTFSMERLRSTIDMMSIGDSESEEDSEGSGSDLYPLLSTGNWAGEALDATLSPLEEGPPLLRAWPMDSSLAGEEYMSTAGRDTFGSLLDAQELLFFLDGQETDVSEPASTACGHVAADCMNTAQPPPLLPTQTVEHRPGGIVATTGLAESSKPKNVGISVALSRKECDFMGRAETASCGLDVHGIPESACSNDLHTICFSGLDMDRSALGVEALSAKVHFWVHPMHSVARETICPIKVDVDGRARATVRYPSMQELSPVVNDAVNIRVVEVDVTVMLRSRDGDVKHTSSNMKVTYRRPAWREEAPGRYPRTACRRISISTVAPEDERPATSEAAEDKAARNHQVDINNNVAVASRHDAKLL